MEATEFKEKCLGLLDELSPEGIVITRDGRPVARVVPYSDQRGAMIGSLRHKIALKGDLLSSGESWKAAPGARH